SASDDAQRGEDRLPRAFRVVEPRDDRDRVLYEVNEEGAGRCVEVRVREWRAVGVAPTEEGRKPVRARRRLGRSWKSVVKWNFVRTGRCETHGASPGGTVSSARTTASVPGSGSAKIAMPCAAASCTKSAESGGGVPRITTRRSCSTGFHALCTAAERQPE